MRSRFHDALKRSRAGFTELRIRRVWSHSILVRDRTTESAASADDTGGMVRCCSPGTGWGMVGFSGTDHLDAHLLRAHELSLEGNSRQPVALAPIPVRELEAVTPIPEDPRTVPLSEKRQHAEALAEQLSAVDRRVASTRVLLTDSVVETWLATSEGLWIHDRRSEVGVAVLAVATEGGNLERAVGSVRIEGGWPAEVPGLALAREVAERAVERLRAAPVRPGRYTVVLDGAAAGVLVHRAMTHLARPSLPGADPDVLPLGTRVGPELLTVGDDPSALGLAGSREYDDEGSAARRTIVIQNGVVVGHLHSRETAAAARQSPTGHARAGSLRGEPYPRASNSFLAQGQGTLGDLLEDVATGLYVTDVMGCEGAGDRLALRASQARMIRRGRLAEPVKGVELGGELLSLLGRVEGIAGDFGWDRSVARCRDGNAGVIPIATGAPHLRLSDVAIGAGA